MMRSMFAGVSGLRAHQTQMDVIGNNIANVNTIGYKGSRVTFQDILSQTITNASSPVAGGDRGGTNPQQVGLGVSLGSIDVIHEPGNIQPTGVNTDLALEGDGYFVVTDGAKRYYTRSGAFGLDGRGNIVNSTNGMYVAGWIADDDGKIDVTQPLGNLMVPLGAAIAPKATENVVFGGNLDANSNGELTLSSSDFTVYDGSEEFDFSVKLEPTGKFNEYNLVITSETEGTFFVDNTNVGNSLEKQVSVVWDSSAGKWELSGLDTFEFNPTSGSLPTITVDLNTDAVSSGGNLFTVSAGSVSSIEADYKPVQAVQTAVVYDSVGTGHTITATFEKKDEKQWTWTVATASNDTATGTLVFDESGRKPSFTHETLTFQPGGADELTIDFDFSNLTKYDDDTALFLLAQDGYPSGTLEGFSIDSNGVLTGEFSNGLTKALGQIAVASFANPGGLLRAGENLFAASNNSGDVNIGTAGSGGRGTITPGAVEMSNVDLSMEFTNMIITQRGFQANSRIITASDEMLQELVNLKR